MLREAHKKQTALIPDAAAVAVAYQSVVTPDSGMPPVKHRDFGCRHGQISQPQQRRCCSRPVTVCSCSPIPGIEEALHDVASVTEHNLHLDVCSGLGNVMDAPRTAEVHPNLQGAHHEA